LLFDRLKDLTFIKRFFSNELCFSAKRSCDEVLGGLRLGDMEVQLLEIAINYAKRGWPVLPLHNPANGYCSCGIKCTSPGKHPRITGGVHAASTDLEIIKSWWHNWPQANIGIATGMISNLIVIDLDERHGGVEAFRAWEKEHPAQTGLISKTGDGNRREDARAEP